MIPVFSVIASKSNVGKTIALCNIIKELKSRGYIVATIKHDLHSFDMDHPGKDTFLHAQAGADIVCISSPKKMAIIEKREIEAEYLLDELIAKIQNVDIILTEGYKHENKPKIEVFRSDIAEEIYSSDDELFALITDTPVDKDVPQFNLDTIDKLVDLIEESCLKK